MQELGLKNEKKRKKICKTFAKKFTKNKMSGKKIDRVIEAIEDEKYASLKNFMKKIENKSEVKR